MPGDSTDGGGSGGGGGGSLPAEIVQSIAISNAKSIGEQPAILANLALANQILNTNLQQQMAISTQQAMNQIIMATMSKAVSLIIGAGNGSKEGGNAKEALEILKLIKSDLSKSSEDPNAPKPPNDWQ